VARDLAPPRPSGPGAAAGLVPPSGLRRVLRKEAIGSLQWEPGREAKMETLEELG
jgi:hypothetical protein